MTIKKITARKILASMGDETVEATIEFADGTKSSASVPAGISAGKYEIRKATPSEAVKQIEQINKICSDKEWTQKSLDLEIFSYGFGGNATLAVSAAFFKSTLPLTLDALRFPKLMLLLFEGGRHGNPNISIQEFLLIQDNVVQAEKNFQKMRTHLEDNKIETLVGTEGGFSPENFDNTLVLKTIKEVFPDKKIALDVAGSFKTGEEPDYRRLTADYRIVSIEDPYTDEDWDKWTQFTRQFGSKILVVGDDLTATNSARIQKAVDLKAINAVVIKPNQIGTITGAMAAVDVARRSGLKIIVSHRGEETGDTWIVDFALAVGADFVKFGGMDRGERIAKYNRLKELGME